MLRPHLDPFPRARQTLHWLVAALILALIPIGLIMARTLDDGLRLGLYQAHLIIGWTVVALSIARLVHKVRRKVPLPPGLAPWNRWLHDGVQWVVAVLPLLLALSGMVTILQNDLAPLLLAGEAPPATLAVARTRDTHMVGAYAFAALLVIHVAGVVRYQATHGNVLARMGIGNARG